MHTTGGDLTVELKGEGAYLMGPAEEVCEGIVKLWGLYRAKVQNYKHQISNKFK